MLLLLLIQVLTQFQINTEPPSFFECVVALYEANGARQCSNVKLNCTAL